MSWLHVLGCMADSTEQGASGTQSRVWDVLLPAYRPSLLSKHVWRSVLSVPVKRGSGKQGRNILGALRVAVSYASVLPTVRRIFSHEQHDRIRGRA